MKDRDAITYDIQSDPLLARGKYCMPPTATQYKAALVRSSIQCLPEGRCLRMVAQAADVVLVSLVFRQNT